MWIIIQKKNELLTNFEFSLQLKGGVILKGNRDHVVPIHMKPWIEYYNGPVPYEHLSARHKTLVKMGATGYSCVRKYVSRRLKVFIKTHLEP